MNEIPVIDFDNFDKGGDSHRRAIAHQVDSATSEVGFMYVTNLGVDQALLAEAFRSSAAFFARPESEKAAVPYVQEWNHGYQGSGGQRLDPSIAPDLKEAFTMRDVHKNENTLELWPSPEFLQIAGRMFDECLHAANRVMQAFAIALDLPPDFFRGYHYGENVSLRYLHYPLLEDAPAANQFGAGAHTDFGTITLLFQDDVGGLQVQDRDGHWRDAVYIADTVVINTGDLVASWTNDRYCSTPHRVKPMDGERERYSIAYFVDPDPDTPVSAFASCVSANNPAKYKDTTAGAYIAARIAESNQVFG